MSALNVRTTRNMTAPPMPDEWVRKAIELFSVPSSSYNEAEMILYLVDQIKINERFGMNISYEMDTYGNLLVIKGESELYPCFCAHLDTVHTYTNGFHVREDTSELDKNAVQLYAVDNADKAVGIGGDDKCGIFVCLYLLQKLECVKTIFFSQEETGGIGSGGIDLSFFTDCMFLGGIDRWNGNDFVNTYSGVKTISRRFNRDISPILQRYEYSYTSGMFTDSFNVQQRGVNLSTFNMSCGYYAHHSNAEYVDLNELWNACLLAEELGNLPPRKYHFQLPPSRILFGRWRNSETGKSYDSHWNKYSYNSYDRDWYDDIKDVWCMKCGIKLFEYEIESYGCYCGPCAKVLNALEAEIEVTETFKYCKNCDLELTEHEKKNYNGYCYYCWGKLPQNNDDGEDVPGTEEDDSCAWKVYKFRK